MFSTKNPAIIRLTRDLTIEDFSDIDLSDITFDDYRSSMESLTKARDKIKIKTLLPRRRAPISRSQSLRGQKSLVDGSEQFNKRQCGTTRKLVQQDTLSLGDYPIRDTNNTPGIYYTSFVISSMLNVNRHCTTLGTFLSNQLKSRSTDGSHRSGVVQGAQRMGRLPTPSRRCCNRQWKGSLKPNQATLPSVFRY